MRDDTWLTHELDLIWQKYFPDIAPANKIIIKFGRCARNQLGSIKMKRKGIFSENSPTTITINGFFQKRQIPKYVIWATLAHELVHYAQGFNSPHQKTQKYPHLGGVVTQELKKRKLGRILKKQKIWLKTEWPKFLKQYRVLKPKTRRKRSHFRLIFNK